MWFRLLLAFILFPLLELWLLLRIGAWLGLGLTLALILLSGVAGATLARREGARAWSAVQAEMAAGRVPGRELLEALLVFLAGMALVMPGVLSDAAGLAILIRPVRTALARRLEARYGRTLDVPPDGPSPGRGRVIEI